MPKAGVRRRLFFDIETSPNVGFFWNSGRKVSIGYENIIHERAIICIAWKWASENSVHALTWDDNQCDRAMLEKFISVLDSADEIIAHNGDRFDITWIRTRCIKHGIAMMPTYTSIDTLKQARRSFRFNSNRLDYIAQFLGVGAKIDVDFDLWKDIVLRKSKKSLREMVRYCKHDVKVLEMVWNRLQSYVVPRSATNIRPAANCPECGSEDLRANQRRKYTPQGYAKVTYRCMDCGKYHTVAASKWDKEQSMRREAERLEAEFA